MAFNGDALRELAAQFLALAEKQGATIPLMIGHRLMGISLLYGRRRSKGERISISALALYDPAEHRSLANAIGSRRPGVNLCRIGHGPCGSLAIPRLRSQTRSKRSEDAREIGHAAASDVSRLSHATRLTHISLRKLFQQQTGFSMNLSLWRTRKAALYLEGQRNDVARLALCPNRQSRRRGSRNHRRHRRYPINGSNLV